MNGKGETIAIRRFKPDLVGEILPSEKMKDRVLLVSTAASQGPRKMPQTLQAGIAQIPSPLKYVRLRLLVFIMLWLTSPSARTTRKAMDGVLGN